MASSGEGLKKSVLFAIPMGVLVGLAVWVGTINASFGLQGSLVAGGVFMICYVSIAFIISQQQSTGGGFSSQ